MWPFLWLNSPYKLAGWPLTYTSTDTCIFHSVVYKVALQQDGVKNTRQSSYLHHLLSAHRANQEDVWQSAFDTACFTVFWCCQRETHCSRRKKNGWKIRQNILQRMKSPIYLKKCLLTYTTSRLPALQIYRRMCFAPSDVMNTTNRQTMASQFLWELIRNENYVALLTIKEYCFNFIMYLTM